MMKAKPIVKGVAAGAAAGAVCYVVSKSTGRQRRCLKRNAEKTLKSFVDMLSGFSDMI